jgi:hypothetical protein
LENGAPEIGCLQLGERQEGGSKGGKPSDTGQPPFDPVDLSIFSCYAFLKPRRGPCSSGDSFPFLLSFPPHRVRRQMGRFERETRNFEGKTMKKLFFTALTIAIVIVIGSALRPYWNRYWIQKDLDVAAVYGTKNTEEHTKQFLLDKLKEDGYSITENDISIEKDSKNTATVTARYTDKISIFGKEIQKLDFTVTATEREVKEYY